MPRSHDSLEFSGMGSSETWLASCGMVHLNVSNHWGKTLVVEVMSPLICHLIPSHSVVNGHICQTSIWLTQTSALPGRLIYSWEVTSSAVQRFMASRLAICDHHLPSKHVSFGCLLVLPKPNISHNNGVTKNSSIDLSTVRKQQWTEFVVFFFRLLVILVIIVKAIQLCTRLCSGYFQFWSTSGQLSTVLLWGGGGGRRLKFISTWEFQLA